MKNLDSQNAIYLSPYGDDLAREELNPVVLRYAPIRESLDILEIGCGYGRNLIALAEIPGARVFGCDVSEEELEKSKSRLTAAGKIGVTLKVQTDPKLLPYESGSFDVVVLWQVLEHVFTDEEKQAVLDEAVRACRKGGVIIIETPNFLFPIDYHDTNLPLVHWVLPIAWRRAVAKHLRSDDFYPSQYISLFGLQRMFRQSEKKCGVNINKISAVYFENRYRDILAHVGGTRIGWKKIFFRIYFPLYLLLRLLGFSGDLLMPSLRVVYRVK